MTDELMGVFEKLDIQEAGWTNVPPQFNYHVDKVTKH